MKTKYLFILIAYFSFLSTLYSLESTKQKKQDNYIYQIDLSANIDTLPITYLPYNPYIMTGLSGTFNLTYYFHGKYGLTFSTYDIYSSYMKTINATFGAANNTFAVGAGFSVQPIEELKVHLTNHFLWNRSAYHTEYGDISENRFGIDQSIGIDYRLPLKEPFFRIGQYNRLQFFPFTRTESFQFEYEGFVRFSIDAFIPNINFYVDTGAIYTDYDTAVIKNQSVYLLWRVGVSFGHTFTNKKPKLKVQLVNPKFIAINSESFNLPTPKIKPKSELYKKLEQTKAMAITRIYNVFFDNTQDIKSESLESLDDLAGFMNDNPTSVIVIFAYVDSQPRSDATMVSIGAKRSNAIKLHLENKGIDPSRIKRTPSAIIYNGDENKIPKGNKGPWIEIKFLKK